VQYQKRPF